MFYDCNVLYWLQEEWAFGPDSDFYDELDGAHWRGFTEWSDDKFNAAIDARKAWLSVDLDTRPLEQRPDHVPRQALCKRLQAVVDAHRAQERKKWNQRMHSWQEQHTALKKQKRE